MEACGPVEKLLLASPKRYPAISNTRYVSIAYVFQGWVKTAKDCTDIIMFKAAESISARHLQDLVEQIGQIPSWY